LVYLRPNNIVLNIELRGWGEPIVLISDIGEDLTAWTYQACTFGNFHFFLQMNNRGSGWLDCPTDGSSVGDMAKDVLCTLDKIGVDQTHIVGLGLGGMIAQEMAISRHGRVNGLVLVSTSPSLTVMQRLTYDAWVSSGKEGADHTTISRFMVPWLYSGGFLTHPGWRDFVVRARGASYRWLSWEGAEAQLQAMMAFDSMPGLGSITAPTLIIHGEHDRLTPGSCAAQLDARIEGSRRLSVDAGHLLYIELPKTFNQTVLGFLSEVEGNPVPDLGPGIPIPCGGLGI
jgi:3-oxoadipate enol-lactonase